MNLFDFKTNCPLCNSEIKIYANITIAMSLKYLRKARIQEFCDINYLLENGKFVKHSHSEHEAEDISALSKTFFQNASKTFNAGEVFKPRIGISKFSSRDYRIEFIDLAFSGYCESNQDSHRYKYWTEYTTQNENIDFSIMEEELSEGPSKSSHYKFEYGISNVIDANTYIHFEEKTHQFEYMPIEFFTKNNNMKENIEKYLMLI